ncbi:ABC transporter substrate-binding protein [Brucella gallinifaecis]|uniref:ABC transporter substrate-binding protein n=1 Tax=Brucella gallinifaecis TaxID=215590 RepID=UPI0023622638|nr:ABC transporter substrate-binding protein [Brucella gallinifaecis]
MTKIARILMATVASMALATAANAADVKVGIILGFTGPTESIEPNVAKSAELAAEEVNKSGLLLNGTKIVTVRGDSTCIDASAATAAAERQVTSDKVAAIMGADCSGVTTAIVNNVTAPNGVVMISPSATSPALTDIKDNGTFFRTVPSDARLGVIMKDILLDRGIKKVALTYSNSDYGKGMTDSFSRAYDAAGGTITIKAPHDDGKSDYSAEVGVLAAAGGDALVVFGYGDQGGLGVVRQSIESGAFKRYVFGDGMYYQSVLDALGKDLDGTIGAIAGSEGASAEAFAKVAKAGGLDPESTYIRESYDAMAVIALAMQKAGSIDRTKIRDAVMAVANGPGEKILPGELAKGLKVLKDGGSIDYVGATNVQFTDKGDVEGSYREYEVKDGKFVTVRMR